VTSGSVILITEHETNSTDKTIRGLFRGIHELETGYHENSVLRNMLVPRRENS
jgi:hypothetical protein